MRGSVITADVGYNVRAKQRSRNGCRTCRSRKVKCDEKVSGCDNCLRLNLPCPNSPATYQALQQGELLRTQAGLRRSRTYRSCRHCRVSKSRCSGERPQCTRCRDRGFECAYDGKQAPAWLEAASQEVEARTSNQKEASTNTGISCGPSTSPSPSQANPTPSSQNHPIPHSSDSTVPGWLVAEELPSERERLLELIKAFFVNIYPLRSFGFIHKPSVLQQFENRDWSDGWRKNQPGALLLSICALGAKFCALEYANESQLANGLALSAGIQWARQAHEAVSLNLDQPSVETTMTIVLLHEHEVRVGHFGNAFLMARLGVRMAQTLKIDLESCPDVLYLGGGALSATIKESRRRLMWAIYIMDSWAGNGINESNLLDDADLKVQLPCSDCSFELGRPRIVEVLKPGTCIPFISPDDRIGGNVECSDLRGHFIRLVSLRRRVLRSVRQLEKAHSPGQTGSEFSVLHSQVQQWLEHLPEVLRFTPSAIYQRKQHAELGAFFLCHITYHQTICDLTRTTTREAYLGQVQYEYSAEKAACLRKAQDHCFDQNMAICALFEKATGHGREALTDSWLSTVAHDSVQMITEYVSRRIGSSSGAEEALRTHAIPAIHSAVRALEIMMPMHAHAQSLRTASIKLVLEAGLPAPHPLITGLIASSGMLEHAKMPATRSAQRTPMSVPQPLAFLREAEKGTSEHAMLLQEDTSHLRAMLNVYSESYKSTSSVSPSFSSHSFPPTTTIELPAPSAPIPQPLLLNNAPSSPAPMALLTGDAHGLEDHDVSGKWNLDIEYSTVVVDDLQALLATDAMTFPAQDWLAGTSTPSAGFDGGHQYPPTPSWAYMSIRGNCPSTHFAPPHPYHEPRSAGQEVEWSV